MANAISNEISQCCKIAPASGFIFNVEITKFLLVFEEFSNVLYYYGPRRSIFQQN